MNRFAYLIGTIALLFSMLSPSAQAQDKKATISMDLTYHQQNDDLPVLRVYASSKVERRFLPAEGVEIALFFEEETAQGFMGRVETNVRGMASLRLPAKYKNSWDSLTNFKFIATVTDNEGFEDESVEIDIAKARIALTLEEEDSVRMIYAKLSALEDSSWTDVPETEIKFIVRRLLS
ncbi:MAG: hypothetical protein OEW40_16820, partial [Cyclobacteriaceae bacterium]|nr:hypothetical protein [Cyclobacteriaceae bacterium]